MVEKKKGKRGRKPLYPKLGKMKIFGFAAPPALMKRWKRVAKDLDITFGEWVRRVLEQIADRHENARAKKTQNLSNPRPLEGCEPE